MPRWGVDHLPVSHYRCCFYCYSYRCCCCYLRFGFFGDQDPSLGPSRRPEDPSEAVAESKTIIWNGPMGVFEMSKFEIGTLDMRVGCRSRVICIYLRHLSRVEVSSDTSCLLSLWPGPLKRVSCQGVSVSVRPPQTLPQSYDGRFYG